MAFGQSSIGIGAWAGHRADPAITCGGVRTTKGLVRAIFLAVDNALALDRVLQLAANITIDDCLANQLDLFGFAVIDSSDTFGDHQFKLGRVFLTNSDTGALGHRCGAMLETFRVLLDGQLVSHQGHGATGQDDVAFVNGLLGNIVVSQGIGQHGGVRFGGSRGSRLGQSRGRRQQSQAGSAQAQGQGTTQKAKRELGLVAQAGAVRRGHGGESLELLEERAFCVCWPEILTSDSDMTFNWRTRLS